LHLVGFEPRDLVAQQRDPLIEFLDRQQRQVLPDLVDELLLRAVFVVECRHREKSSAQAAGCHMRLRRLCSPRPNEDRPMTVPARRTAIAIREPGAPQVLVPQERDTPAPKQGEVLVKVAAAGVNRPDVMQREGKYPPPPGASDIPGLELAGEVVALGEGVK